jgi:SAM-dependent methyltransferase
MPRGCAELSKWSEAKVRQGADWVDMTEAAEKEIQETPSIDVGVRRSETEPRDSGMDLVNPSLRDFSYLDCRRRSELIEEHAARLPRHARTLVDIGGKGKPYACFFAGRVKSHLVMDIAPAPSVDLVGDARKMPLADSSVDAVLITQVLEHVPEPLKVIAEIQRVLKPGGTLLLSVPSIFPQHGFPGDYWRYMPEGLRWILRDFRDVHVEGEAGTVPTIFLYLNIYLQLLCSPSRALTSILRWTICPLNNVLGLIAGKVYRGNQFASNYFVAAIR